MGELSCHGAVESVPFMARILRLNREPAFSTEAIRESRSNFTGPTTSQMAVTVLAKDQQAQRLPGTRRTTARAARRSMHRI